MRTILILAMVGMVMSRDPGLVQIIDNIFSTTAPVQPNSEASVVPVQSPEDCVCVVYYQCHNKTTLNVNGKYLMEPRFAPCVGAQEICCPVSKIKTNSTPSPPLTMVPLDPPIAQICGARNFSAITTPYRVNQAQFGEFPWVAVILRNDKSIGAKGGPYSYQCGGSLIHPQVVLTAAHCVGTSTNFIVRLGEWDSQTTVERLPHQDRKIIRSVVHPNYNTEVLYNDFALLFLDSPVNLTTNVGLICLPQFGEVFDGTQCLAAGWGKNVFGRHGQYQTIMKKVELPIRSFSNCLSLLRKTRLGRYFQLDRSFICAGGEAGRDTCHGDGGSPLFCPLAEDPTRYVQAGIVSWGVGCGDQNIPGVYANVAAAREWIDQQLAQNLPQ